MVQMYELYVTGESVETKWKRRTEDIVNEVVELMVEEKFDEALTVISSVSPEISKHDRGINFLKNRIQLAVTMREYK